MLVKGFIGRLVMKNIILAIIISLLFCSGVRAGDGVLHLNMEEASGNLTDLSGYGNNCTAYGNPVYQQTGAPNRGKAISFDGSGDYFNCGNSVAFNSSAVTVLGWIKTGIQTSAKTIMGKAVTGSISWRISKVVVGNLLFYVSGNGTSYNLVSGIGNYMIGDNNWHHFGCVYDNTTGFVYIDGVLNASG